MESIKPKSVILDVDVGTDDAWAILMALNNESKANFKVRAITCVFGNAAVDYIGKNVLRVLDTVNRLDVRFKLLSFISNLTFYLIRFQFIWVVTSP